ncbi:MAG: O-antigen ligase family protein [Paracoccaceae bacterium]
MSDATFALIAPPRRVTIAIGARLVLGLLILRWLAGIIENFGVPAISQASALVMMAGMGALFLGRMRLASGSVLCVAGLLAWMFTGALSYVANPDADQMDAVSLLLLLGLYALFVNAAATYLKDRTALPAIQKFITGFILIGALLSVYQLASGTGFIEAGKSRIVRAFGSDVHPVSFAIQMVAALVTLEIIRVKRGQRVGAVHLLLLCLALLVIYLTYARTAWVMGLLTVAFVLLSRGSWLRRGLTLGMMATVLLLALQTSDRFADLGSLPFFLSNFTFGDVVFDYRYIDNSVSWRLVNWSFGLHQALQQPVLGFGPGTSATASQFSLEMHNILLETFFEGGFLGLGSFLIMLAGIIRMHRRLPSDSASDIYTRALTNGFGLSLLMAVVFSTSFVDQLMSVLMYLLLLTVAAIPRPPPRVMP